jgi:hypothetical protein
MKSDNNVKGVSNMCLNYRLMPRKARMFLAIGNVCLFAGIVAGNFGHSFGVHQPGWYDFLRGLLMGLAITFNFAAVRFSRRQPPSLSC